MSDAHHDSGREYYWNAQPKPDKDRIRELEIQLKANSDLLEKVQVTANEYLHERNRAQARLDAMTNDRIIPIEYEIKGTREPDGRFPWRIVNRLQREGTPKWVVRDSLGQVVTVDGKLEWEQTPSYLTPEFIKRTRFDSPAEALVAFDLFMEKENSK